MSWRQRLYQNQRDEDNQKQGLGKPYLSMVKSVSPQNEKAVVANSSTRSRLFTISHPFVSHQAWIRAMPQDGTRYLTVTRSDDSEPQLTSTFMQDVEERINGYLNGQGAYRVLYPGEMELSSKGFAQSYYSRRPILNQRGGVVERTANQDYLKTYDRAPLHHQTLFKNKVGKLGDERKTGIVERYRNRWRSWYPKINGQFAAEDFIDLKNPAGENPTTLFRRQRGHVINEQGSPINHSITSLPLRFQELYYSNDDTITRREIDNLGNTYIKLSPAATDGYQVDVPGGNIVYKINQDWKATIDANRITNVGGTDNKNITGNWKVSVDGDTNIKTNNVTIASQQQLIMKMQQMLVEAQQLIQMNASNININATAAAQFFGAAGTSIGSPGGITSVSGASVILGGGSLPVGRLFDKIVGNTVSGEAVMGFIAQGAPTVVA